MMAAAGPPAALIASCFSALQTSKLGTAARANQSLLLFERALTSSYNAAAAAGRRHGCLLTPPSVMQVKNEQNEAESMQLWISTIKEFLHGIDNVADVYLSAYDIAWIARVPVSGSAQLTPLFPQCIGWIIDNQAYDGSWGQGDEIDRLCSTLACTIALKTWNKGASSIQKGLKFIKAKLTSYHDHLAKGIMIVLSGLLEELDLTYETPLVQEIRAERHAFLQRFTAEMLHEYPTSFVHCLEGIHKLANWGKLLRFQCSNGSFYNSPSLTACAYMHTNDTQCLHYLNSVIENAHKSVPWSPSNILEQLHVVDWLEHLGIERHFDQEIQEILGHAFRYWKGNAIGSGRQAHIRKVEDAALCFRILRRHGYQVLPDVFHHTTGEGEVTPLGAYKLYLASQTLYPGETILEKIRSSTKDLLWKNMRTHRTVQGLFMKQLNEEVHLSLKFPWYNMLQRVGHRQYITQFKTDYYPPREENAIWGLSKSDFNACQVLFQKELQQIIEWNEESKFSQLGFARQKGVLSYFSAAATMFEPEMSMARIVWAQMSVLATVLDDYFDTHVSVNDLRKFCAAVRRWDSSIVEGSATEMQILFHGLYNTVNRVVEQAFLVQGRDIGAHLRAQWDRLVHAYLKEAEWRLSSSHPSMEEYISNGVASAAIEPITMAAIFFTGARVSDNVVDHADTNNMIRQVSLIGRLLNDIQGYKRESSQGECSWITIHMREHPEATKEECVTEMRKIIDRTMVELVEDFLCPRAPPKACKRVFESMTRILSFFYKDVDGFTSDDLAKHVNNVLNVQYDTDSDLDVSVPNNKQIIWCNHLYER